MNLGQLLLIFTLILFADSNQYPTKDIKADSPKNITEMMR